jgi:hypothetical protein
MQGKRWEDQRGKASQSTIVVHGKSLEEHEERLRECVCLSSRRVERSAILRPYPRGARLIIEAVHAASVQQSTRCALHDNTHTHTHTHTHTQIQTSLTASTSARIVNAVGCGTSSTSPRKRGDSPTARSTDRRREVTVFESPVAEARGDAAALDDDDAGVEK